MTKKAKVSYFRSTVLHDHAASRLVKIEIEIVDNISVAGLLVGGSGKSTRIHHLLPHQLEDMMGLKKIDLILKWQI